MRDARSHPFPAKEIIVNRFFSSLLATVPALLFTLMFLCTAPFCVAEEPSSSTTPSAEVSSDDSSETETEKIQIVFPSSKKNERFVLYGVDLTEYKKVTDQYNIIHIFEEGGLIMYPLLLASILALSTVIDRLFFLFWVRLYRDPKSLKKFLKAVSDNDIEEALRIGKKSKFYVLRILNYALENSTKSMDNALESSLLYAQEQEMKRFRWGIPMLDTIITLAPLLGLLGTVTGMMGSFALIGGEVSTPGAITGGIAEALIATAFGLGVAITSLLPFNYLNNQIEEAHKEIESAALQLELLVIHNKKAQQAKAA